MVRFKNRAVLVQICPLDGKPIGTSLTNANFHEAVRKACSNILGEKASTLCANLRIKYLNCWTNMALITCRKSELMELRCSLPFVTAIEHGSRGTRRYSFTTDIYNIQVLTKLTFGYGKTNSIETNFKCNFKDHKSVWNDSWLPTRNKKDA